MRTAAHLLDRETEVKGSYSQSGEAAPLSGKQPFKAAAGAGRQFPQVAEICPAALAIQVSHPLPELQGESSLAEEVLITQLLRQSQGAMGQLQAAGNPKTPRPALPCASPGQASRQGPPPHSQIPPRCSPSPCLTSWPCQLGSEHLP